MYIGHFGTFHVGARVAAARRSAKGSIAKACLARSSHRSRENGLSKQTSRASAKTERAGGGCPAGRARLLHERHGV